MARCSRTMHAHIHMARCALYTPTCTWRDASHHMPTRTWRDAPHPSLTPSRTHTPWGPTLTSHRGPTLTSHRGPTRSRPLGPHPHVRQDPPAAETAAALAAAVSAATEPPAAALTAAAAHVPARSNYTRPHARAPSPPPASLSI